MDGSPNPHDILAVLGRQGACQVPGGRDPGGLPAPGRAHQRQAHRDDRPPDAAPGADRRRRGHRRSSSGRASRSGGSRRRTSGSWSGRREARHGGAAAPRDHQGVAFDGVVHLRRLLPGDDQGPHRGVGPREGRPPRRAEGERDHGPPDPRRNGRRDVPGHRIASPTSRWWWKLARA